MSTYNSVEERKTSGDLPGRPRHSLDMIQDYSKKQVSSNILAVSSTFAKNTIDNENYESCLEQEDIKKLAWINYGWYGVKSDVLFEVIMSVEQLKVQLENHKSMLLNKKSLILSLTFVINVNKNHWVTLVIAHKGQSYSVYYIDSLRGGMPKNIKEVLTIVFENEMIAFESFPIQQGNDYNCGIFALENAKIINVALKDSSLSVQEELSNFKPSVDCLRNIREDFAVSMYREDIVQNKLEVYLKILQGLKNQKMNKFNHKLANIFILFLEVLAMEDPELQIRGPLAPSGMYKTELVERGIIDENELECIKYVRYLIMHRKINSTVDPSTIETILTPELSGGIGDFFQGLENYVTQVLKRFRGDVADKNSKKLCELLKSKSDIEELIETKSFYKEIGTTDEARKITTDFFDNVVKEAHKNERPNLEKADEMIFNFIANVMPLVGIRYKKGLPDPLNGFKWLQGDLLHKFYQYGDRVELRNLYFKKCVRHIKHNLLAYCYSQKVYIELSKVQNDSDLKITVTELEHLLTSFRANSGRKYVSVREVDGDIIDYVASELIYKKIDDKSNLESFVHEYLKLMAIVDNEEAIEKREVKFKTTKVPGRYDKLSGGDRMKIYEAFNLLKGMKDFKDEFEEKKKLLESEFRRYYGILKKDFGAMVKCYVENDNCSESEKNYVTDIYNLLLDNLNKKDSKFSSLQGQTIENIIYVCISSEEANITKLVKINRDKLAQNILEMLNEAYVSYCLDFGTIEAAFNNEIFVDYLVREGGEKIQNKVQKLLELKYTAPYVARLLAGGKLSDINFEFKNVLRILLNEDSYIKYVNELLAMDKKRMEKILQPNQNSSGNLSVYKEIFNIIDKDKIDIKILCPIFEEPEYVKGILNFLIKKGDKHLIIKVMKLLNDVALKHCKKANYSLALNLLEFTVQKKRNLIPTLTEKELLNENDDEILQANFTLVQIKFGLGNLEADSRKAEKLYRAAHYILLGVKGTIDKVASCNSSFHKDVLEYECKCCDCEMRIAGRNAIDNRL